MIPEDHDRFCAAYRQLAVSLSAKPPAHEAVQAAYYDACPFPLAAVEDALEVLRKTSRFMPRPVQFIGACQDAARRHASNGGDVPPWVNHDEARYFCTVCDDTGFERRLACDGSGVCRIGRCGKELDADKQPLPSPAHPFTRRCSCRATNPVLAKDRDALRRPADGDRVT